MKPPRLASISELVCACPECGKAIRIWVYNAGKEFKCPFCKTRLAVDREELVRWVGNKQSERYEKP